MSISMYDPNLWDGKLPSNVVGGINRAKKAKRLQGKFLPNDEFIASLITPDPEHGKPGGLARIKKAVRDLQGRFVKAQ